MPRVVGTDPGTSSLDLLLLDDGDGRRPGAAPARAAPRRSRDPDPAARHAGRRSTWSPRPRAMACRWSGARSSPTTTSSRCRWSVPTSGARLGVIGFRAWVRAFVGSGCAAGLPAGRPASADDPRPPQGERHRPGDGRQGRRRGAGALVRRDRAGRFRSTRRSPSSSSARRSRRSWSSIGGRLVDASAGTRGPIGPAIGRMLGRRGRLLARSALQGRPVPRRPGRPRRDRARRLPRIADQARRRLARRSRRSIGSISRAAAWNSPRSPR